MYEAALYLIESGHAYVDSQSAEEMRANRGTLTEPGRDSPYRGRSVEENLTHRRDSADLARWDVNVEGGGRTLLAYRVRTL